MYNIILFSSLFSLAIASNQLAISVTAPSSVASIDQIFLLATVTNHGASPVRVLKYGSVLDNLPTNSFTVSKDLKNVPFTGITISIDTTVAGTWVTIPAGGSISANHTIAGLYDFETAGTGTFNFAPFTKFRAETNEIITAFSAPVPVTVILDVGKRQVQHHAVGSSAVFPRTSTPSCANTTKGDFMAGSLADAKALAKGVATNILQNSRSQQFISYFDGNTKQDIWYNFYQIGNDSGTRNLYCEDSPGGFCTTPGVIAYTLTVISGGQTVSSNIYACSSFYNFPANTALCSGAQYTRGGIILHELSHAIFGTSDIIYGCGGAINLSPSDKKNNADNYRCMGQDVYRVVHKC